MTQLVRRPATEADRDFVFRVKTATQRYAVEAAWGWDENAQRRLHDDRFDRGGMEILLDGDERAGCLKILREADRIRLLSIHLLPPWQSRGIGTSILTRLQQEAGVAGMTIDLGVLHANVRARALYERLGFVVMRTTEAHHEMQWQPPGGSAAG